MTYSYNIAFGYMEERVHMIWWQLNNYKILHFQKTNNEENQTNVLKFENTRIRWEENKVKENYLKRRKEEESWWVKQRIETKIRFYPSLCFHQFNLNNYSSTHYSWGQQINTPHKAAIVFWKFFCFFFFFFNWERKWYRKA